MGGVLITRSVCLLSVQGASAMSSVKGWEGSGSSWTSLARCSSLTMQSVSHCAGVMGGEEEAAACGGV